MPRRSYRSKSVIELEEEEEEEALALHGTDLILPILLILLYFPWELAKKFELKFDSFVILVEAVSVVWSGRHGVGIVFVS